jgi:putative hydrolase of the HAD superfamily
VVPRPRPAVVTQTRGILWDFDGTLAFRSGLWSDLLVETLDIEASGHGHAAAAFRRPMSTGFPWHDWERPRVPPVSASEWWALVTRHLERGLLGAGVAPEVAARAARRARSEYLRIDRWHVFPDTIATLDRLAGDGWRHVILSNHVPELADLVTALGFADRFQAILTSAATGYEKPHEQAFALGREALGNPDLVWMVGDNPVADVYGAERLGIPAALVRRPIPDSTGRTDLAELPRILANSTREPAPRPAERC